MNEIVREYKNDIREKASTARGIYGRKGKSGKGAPKFPSDYLSKKEKNELNGPVTTMDPHKFYTWKEFKQLTPRLQGEYVDGLMTRYDIGLSTISKKVFGRTASALGTHLRSHHIPYKNHGNGKRANKESLAKLARDMGGDRTYKPIFDENGEQEGIEIVGKEIETQKANEPTTKAQTKLEKFYRDHGWDKQWEELNKFPSEAEIQKRIEQDKINEELARKMLLLDGRSPVSFHDISFTMDGFDFEFLKLLADRFPEKVRVSISITTEE